jgi:hypothetical protein
MPENEVFGSALVFRSIRQSLLPSSVTVLDVIHQWVKPIHGRVYFSIGLVHIFFFSDYVLSIHHCLILPDNLLMRSLKRSASYTAAVTFLSKVRDSVSAGNVVAP